MKKAIYIIFGMFFMLVSAQAQTINGTLPKAIELGELSNLELDPQDNYTDNESIYEGERIFFFVHGLGGDENSWLALGNWTQNMYKVRALFPTYEGANLTQAAISLGQSIDNLGDPINMYLGITDPIVNRVIAHSQGGIVTRELERLYCINNITSPNRKFGGIATFGSPHMGAQIIQEVDNIIQFASEGIFTLAQGPMLEEFYQEWYYSLFTSSTDLVDLLEAFTEYFPEHVIPIALGDFIIEITEDYIPEGPGLSILNNHISEIPILAFYGIEDDPELWRLLYSFNQGGSSGFFSEDYDDEYVWMIEEKILDSYSKYWEYNSIYESLNQSSGFWNWLTNSTSLQGIIEGDLDLILNGYFGMDDSDAKEIADAYYDAYKWLLSANDYYLSLIGAIEYNSYVHPAHHICHCEYMVNGEEVFETYNANISETCSVEGYPNAICDSYPIIINERIKHPNDGVVTALSASTLPAGSNYLSIPMYGSNHQQMRNDTNILIQIQLLLNGYYGYTFKTNLR